MFGLGDSSGEKFLICASNITQDANLQLLVRQILLKLTKRVRPGGVKNGVRHIIFLKIALCKNLIVLTSNLDCEFMPSDGARSLVLPSIKLKPLENIAIFDKLKSWLWNMTMKLWGDIERIFQLRTYVRFIYDQNTFSLHSLVNATSVTAGLHTALWPFV